MALSHFLKRLYTSATWHRAEQITPAFERCVAATHPIPCNPAAPVEVHTLVDQPRLWAYLLGIKSLLTHVNELHIVLHDDGSLTAADRVDAGTHIPGIRIIERADADARMADVLAPYPACREFRDNNIVMAQVFDFPEFAETDRSIIFDSDILVLNHPQEMHDWAIQQTNEVLFQYEEAPFSPRIDGEDITVREGVPFHFTRNLCGGLVCGFKSMYELPRIEEYCRYVLDHCHDRLFRAQTITALSVAASEYSARPLPLTYQHPHTFADGAVARHYFSSALPAKAFLTDARKVLKQLRRKPS